MSEINYPVYLYLSYETIKKREFGESKCECPKNPNMMAFNYVIVGLGGSEEALEKCSAINFCCITQFDDFLKEQNKLPLILRFSEDDEEKINDNIYFGDVTPNLMTLYQYLQKLHYVAIIANCGKKHSTKFHSDYQRTYDNYDNSKILDEIMELNFKKRADAKKHTEN